MPDHLYWTDKIGISANEDKDIRIIKKRIT